MQKARVRSLVRELDPTCRNEDLGQQKKEKTGEGDPQSLTTERTFSPQRAGVGLEPVFLAAFGATWRAICTGREARLKRFWPLFLCPLAADAFHGQNPPGSHRTKEAERCSLWSQKRMAMWREEKQTESSPQLPFKNYTEYTLISSSIPLTTLPTWSNEDFKNESRIMMLAESCLLVL